MKHTFLKAVLLSASVFFAFSAQASGPFNDSSRAIEHSAQAALYASSAGVKSVAVAASLPLMAIGVVGDLADSAAEALWESANQPLEIGEDVYTRLPPPNAAN